VTGSRRALLVARLALAALVVPLSAGAPQESMRDSRAGRVAPVPFDVGERLEYDVRFGGIKVGWGSMEVAGTESVRGREAWHTVFRVRGGTLFFKVDDRFESWFDRSSLASLRYWADQREGSRDRERRYEIFPERSLYVEEDGEEQPSVAQPLDDGSFLYFIRTVPLEVGREYEFHRYFKPDRNPVRIRVLRRERITVPAGTYDAVVVQPIIKAKGIFSEGGRAEVWLSDDDTRIVLQMKSRLPFGSINLYLKSHRPAPASSVSPAGSARR
jgi:hypothetical protein